MATPGSSASSGNDKPNKKSPKNFPLRPDQNRGPSQKPDRTHPVSGARRVNRPQGR